MRPAALRRRRFLRRLFISEATRASAKLVQVENQAIVLQRLGLSLPTHLEAVGL